MCIRDRNRLATICYNLPRNRTFGCKVKIAEYKNKLQWGCDRAVSYTHLTLGALLTHARYGENPLCTLGFFPVVWLLPVDLYPSVRYEGFMLACLAAHQPQPVSYTHLDVYKRQILDRSCRTGSSLCDSGSRLLSFIWLG